MTATRRSSSKGGGAKKASSTRSSTAKPRTKRTPPPPPPSRWSRFLDALGEASRGHGGDFAGLFLVVLGTIVGGLLRFVLNYWWFSRTEPALASVT